MTAAAVVLAASTVAVPAAATPAQGQQREAGAPFSFRLHDAVRELSLAQEDRTGYVRTAFRHWVDADRDGCDARREVLIAEAVEPVEVGARCALTGGRWWSRYDDRFLDQAGQLDVDHMVPLAEAWDSGASAWSAAERQAYANDLDDERLLIAVSAASNRSKADKDPAEWMPPYEAYACEY
ncbi:GmrSD restriction endonuclease domain-containing protein, partial [Streptodolium elevatio]